MRIKLSFQLIALILLTFKASSAATIQVSAACGLVGAIISANSNVATGGCPAGDSNARDEIILEPDAIYSLTTPAYSGSDGDTGLPSIVSDIRIVGSGASIQRVAPDFSPPYFRLFHIGETGNLILENTKLINGSAQLNRMEPLYTSSGGAIFNRGTTVIIGSSITENASPVFGGGIYNISGTLTIQGTDIKDNFSEGGGGLYIESGNIGIRDSTITENICDTNGGGIFIRIGTLEIQDSIIDRNMSNLNAGGGLYNAAGNVTVSRTTISNNEAPEAGAGIANGNGVLEIRNSAIASNSTIILEKSSASGGGIANGNIMLVSNTTISGNYAEGGGGAIENSGELKLINVTVSNNESKFSEGVLENDDNRGHMEIVNSIVANNVPGSCDVNTNTSTRLIDLGHNWFDDTSCNGIDRGNPRLKPLSDNGGPCSGQVPPDTFLREFS